ncbi:MAG: hypothetical protein BWK80_55975 [Desulfobacteraceae bacterium IS3]|nr:MAG: hypothetical protein BWK80_55975 [Desulfobacteraceae bacterium IS3]
MQRSEKLSVTHIIESISHLSLYELEDVKKAIIERELYFRKFQKDKIKNIVSDFKKEGYSDEFLSDLEQGLKKSSIYNAD